MSLGSALKSARTAAGLSVEELAARTRIRAALIKELENDNFVNCGGDTYARGHIRAIARILESFEPSRKKPAGRVDKSEWFNSTASVPPSLFIENG